MSFTDKARDKAEELGGEGKEATGEVSGDDCLKAEGEKGQKKPVGA
jgi:uncharacterized protein YjbJ (UPF0337 family)